MSRTARPRAIAIWAIACAVLVLVIAACRDAGGNESRQTGQISRPGDIGLPLDNPVSADAFDYSDRFLLKWFMLNDTDAAAELVHPNLREPWRNLIEDTRIERACSFVQTEGTEPDPSGIVTARYAIGGCNIVPPTGKTAVYIDITISTTGEGAPWVNSVEFLR